MVVKLRSSGRAMTSTDSGVRARAPRVTVTLLLLSFAWSCGLVANSSLGRQLGTGAAMAAKQLCSLVFVSGLEPDRARALYIDPLLRGGDSVIRTDVDRDDPAVEASIPGLLRRRAVHREGYGCTLVQDEERGLEPLSRPYRPSRPMHIDREHRRAAFDAQRLEAALDHAFHRDPDAEPIHTLAAVILHDGVLVAERYAEGITSETRLPGWSMTKSVAATWAGVLAYQGLLDVHAPGTIREWRDSPDPRSRISLDHLLRMTSGLAIEETADRGDGLDPNSVMLYHEPDAAHFAATRMLAHEPGSHFEYMSGSFVLATRVVQDAIGGDPSAAADFLHENLFGPLGMHSAILETDQAGTFLGSSHMLATARDWARFGQLYLDRGVAGGHRIFAQDWLRYVTTPTPASLSEIRHDVFWEPGRAAYGAGFWLYGPAAHGGLPEDSFDANGFQGQYLHVIPSKSLVVVRLGATSFRDYDHDRLPREVIEALRP
jgi:CubicO group peptidase (beta-lactamase class C family)